MTPTELELSHLWAEFQQAWALHHEQLAGRDGRDLVWSTRREALIALESYATALEARRLPVPPRVQRDLRLLRDLCAHQASRWL